MQPAGERQQEQRHQRAPCQRGRTGFAEAQPIIAQPQQQRVGGKVDKQKIGAGSGSFHLQACGSRW